MNRNIIWPACITAAALLAACGTDRDSRYSRYDATQDRDLYANSRYSANQDGDMYSSSPDSQQSDHWSTGAGWNTNTDRTAGNISGNDRSYPYEQSMAYRWSDRDRAENDRAMARDWDRRNRDDWRRDTSYTDNRWARSDDSRTDRNYYSSTDRRDYRMDDHRADAYSQPRNMGRYDYDNLTPDPLLSYSSDSDNWIARGNDTMQQARTEGRSNDYYASEQTSDPHRNYSDPNRRMAVSDSASSNSAWSSPSSSSCDTQADWNSRSHADARSVQSPTQPTNSAWSSGEASSMNQSNAPSSNSTWASGSSTPRSNQSSSDWDSRLGSSSTPTNSTWGATGTSDTRLQSDSRLQTGTSDATGQASSDRMQRDSMAPPDASSTTARPPVTPTSPQAADLSNVTPDARILSVLQMKDQEEVEIGRMAQMNGNTAQVREFGQHLVKDHTDHAAKVRSAAASAGITLLDKDQLMRLEKEHMSKDRATANSRDVDDEEHVGASPDEPAASSATSAPQSNQPGARAEIRGMKAKDPVEALRGLSGAEFDRVFATKMVQGHQKLIKKVEKARSDVRSAEVRSLLDDTLPTLRDHLKTAESIRDDVNTAAKTTPPASTVTPESKPQ